MMEILEITHKEKHTAILNPESRYFDLLREQFSYMDDSLKYTRVGKSIRKYCISKTGEFDVGLVWLIEKYVREKQLEVKLKCSDEVLAEMIKKIDVKITTPGNENFQLRDYQEECVKKCLKLGCGVGMVGTGGGKTYIFATIFETIFRINPDFKAVLVVPSLGLVKQSFDNFKEYGVSFTFSRWTGKHKLNTDSNVIIVNTGIIQRKTEEDCQFLEDVDYLIYDEVHLFANTNEIRKSGSESKAVQMLKKHHFKHKWGFTGSVPPDKRSKYKIYGYFGPVVYEKPAIELAKEGYLTGADVHMVKLNHVNAYDVYVDVEDNQGKYVAEVEYIIGSSLRNNIIRQIAEELDNNVLILVERLAHGEKLLEMLSSSNSGKQVFFIQGATGVDERKQIINIIENNTNVICIAMSKIFSTGISINNLHYLLFCNLGRNWTKVVQSVGRSLRLHESKKRAVIFDIYDNLIFSEFQGNERKMIYAEQGLLAKEKEIYE